MDETPAPPEPGPVPLQSRISSAVVDNRGWVVLEMLSQQGVAVYFLDPEMVPLMAKHMVDTVDRILAGPEG